MQFVQLSQSVEMAALFSGLPAPCQVLDPELEKPLVGTRLADDHINIKGIVADDDGRLYATIKTSLGDDPSDPDSQDRLAGKPPSYAALRWGAALFVRYDNPRYQPEYYEHGTDPYEQHNL